MSDDPDELFKRKVKRIVKDTILRDCLYLVKNGVPFDVAFSLPETDRLAYVILLGELGGGIKWNWDMMEFEPIKPKD